MDLITALEANHVHFQSLTDQIDTSTPAGRFFFHVMSSLDQMERELIVERTQAGLEAARRKGRIGGRKRRMTESKVNLPASSSPAAQRQGKWRITWVYRFPPSTDGFPLQKEISSPAQLPLVTGMLGLALL